MLKGFGWYGNRRELVGDRCFWDRVALQELAAQPIPVQRVMTPVPGEARWMVLRQRAVGSNWRGLAAAALGPRILLA